MASPGGAPKHFWAAVRTTSMPQSSIRSATPPVAVAPEPGSAAAPAVVESPIAGSLFRTVDPPDHFVSVRAAPTKDGREVTRLRPGQTLRCTRKVAGQFRQYEGVASSDWYECPEAGGYVFSLLLRQAR